MHYIIHYDLAALIVTLAVSIHFFYKKTIDTGIVRVFSFLIFCALISNVCDLVSVYTIENAEVFPPWLNYVINQIYLATFNAITLAYYMYVLYLNKKPDKVTLADRLQLYLPYSIDLVLILTTPLTKWIFYMDPKGRYVHGPGMTFLYVVAIFYVLAALVRMVYYRKNFNRSQRVIVYYYTVASLAAIMLQMIVDGLLIIQFAVAVAVLLVYLSLENPQDYSNKQLGTYNDMGFVEILASRIQKERGFTIVGLQIEGMKYISETLGVLSMNLLLTQIADYLQQAFGKRRVFYLSGTQFAVMIKKGTQSGKQTGEQAGKDGREDARDIVEAIQKRFEDTFQIEDMEISLSVPMCMLSYPENVKTVEDVLDALEYSLAEAKEAGGGVVYADEKTLQAGRRELTIIQVMKRAIQQGKFEVWYQPIHSVEKDRFTSAEALIRLIDDEIGFISPEEFIPLAEKNGLILEIGEHVFREVCRFMTANKIWRYGIECIDVNLSVVQCMQEKMYATLLAIMDEFHLDHRYINLEITETAAVVSRETLERNMQQLISRGVEFSLDDYGTGFSNTATIIEYPFHTIKIDKSMVWSAMENQKAMYALKYSVAMIKAMQMDIIAEGVETQEQADMLTEMGCDFFQGYFYSKPIRGEDFLQRLKAQGR